MTRQRNFRLTPTFGLVGGLTIQFAEGRWHRGVDSVGDGVSMPLEAFEIIEPCVKASCAGWTDLSTYGPFEISPSDLPSLIDALRSSVGENKGRKDFRVELADWLASRRADVPISFLGI